MSKIEDLRGKVPPEVEERLEHAMHQFRENHKNPANLALHAAGWYAIAKGVVRFLSGRRYRAVFLILFGLGMVLAGHEIEGTDAFAFLKASGNGHAS